MTTTLSPEQAAVFAEDDKQRAHNIFGAMCALNFCLYGLGHYGVAALLTLLIAASVVSQLKMPGARIGGMTAPNRMMASPKMDEALAERITSPKTVLGAVVAFLLSAAVISAVL